MNRLWLLVPPLGPMVNGGSALYAHRTGNIVLRNVFVACFIAVVVLTAVFQNQSNL